MSSRISATLPGSRRALNSSSIARFSIERLLSATAIARQPIDGRCLCGDTLIIREAYTDVNQAEAIWHMRKCCWHMRGGYGARRLDFQAHGSGLFDFAGFAKAALTISRARRRRRSAMRRDIV